jgi:hypothetical protein
VGLHLSDLMFHGSRSGQQFEQARTLFDDGRHREEVADLYKVSRVTPCKELRIATPAILLDSGDRLSGAPTR